MTMYNFVIKWSGKVLVEKGQFCKIPELQFQDQIYAGQAPVRPARKLVLFIQRHHNDILAKS